MEKPRVEFPMRPAIEMIGLSSRAAGYLSVFCLVLKLRGTGLVGGKYEALYEPESPYEDPEELGVDTGYVAT